MRLAICDDEVASQEKIVSCVEDYITERKTDIEYEVFDRCAELESSIDGFDVFVLDYMMPETDGLAFARKIREKYDESKAVIFVTSFPEIVYDTFEVRTLRFLLKPLEKAKFFEAIDAYVQKNVCNKHIVFKNDEETNVINISDIFYFEVAGKELYVCLEKEQIVCHRSISSVEEEMIPKGFFRVHRSYLVNLDKVKSFDKKTLELVNGERLPISARRYGELCRCWLKRG